MGRIFIIPMSLFLVMMLSGIAGETSVGWDKNTYAQTALRGISSALTGLKPQELELCVSFIKDCDKDSKEIAEMVFDWGKNGADKQIASVFRTRLNRLIERLRLLDHKQLVLYIELVKNSHLTPAQLVKLIKSVKK
jgi:hypothetical protein